MKKKWNPHGAFMNSKKERARTQRVLRALRKKMEPLGRIRTQAERRLAGDFEGKFVTEGDVGFYIVDGIKVAKRESGKDWMSLRAGWRVAEFAWADAEDDPDGESGIGTSVEYDPKIAQMN